MNKKYQKELASQTTHIFLIDYGIRETASLSSLRLRLRSNSASPNKDFLWLAELHSACAIQLGKRTTCKPLISA